MAYNDTPLCPIRNDAPCMGSRCALSQMVENTCVWVCGLVTKGQMHVIQHDGMASSYREPEDDFEF